MVPNPAFLGASAATLHASLDKLSHGMDQLSGAMSSAGSREKLHASFIVIEDDVAAAVAEASALSDAAATLIHDMQLSQGFG